MKNIERIKELENQLFFLEMCGGWKFNDYRRKNELQREIDRLKKEDEERQRKIQTIRRMVCLMANRFKKMGLTLSAAFRRAWELIKGKTVETKVAGVTIGNRQRALHRIATKYTPEAVSVTLERDRANIYDNNAVKVIVSVDGSTAYDMGYIPRNLAYVVSSLLDKGINLAAAFKGVTGKYERYMNYGALITLQLA